ncbi:hypothetical protein GQ600_17290 [Phytophthora cactorum]|nr:hypothetical protein GQ600_17290 [Phytophthora cactorum]
MEEADTESRRSLKGKCAACGKMVSNKQVKHHKVCGKKLLKTRKGQLGADTDDLAEDDIDSLSDAEYDCERRQIRRLDTKKLMVKLRSLAQD